MSHRSRHAAPRPQLDPGRFAARAADPARRDPGRADSDRPDSDRPDSDRPDSGRSDGVRSDAGRRAPRPPGRHSYRPQDVGVEGQRRRVGVLALMVIGIAAVSTRSGPGMPIPEQLAAARSSGAQWPETGPAATGPAAPDVDEEWLEALRRELAGSPGGASSGLTTTAPLPPLPPADTLAAGPGEGAEGGPDRVPPALDAGAGLPPRAVAAYRAAEEALRRAVPGCRLDWSLLAAIGTVESANGTFGGATVTSDGTVSPPIVGIRLDGSRPGTATVRDTDSGRLDGDPVHDRAIGPMQFLPGTWSAFARSATPGKAPDPQDLDDAALTAGWYLCSGSRDLGDPGDRRAAVLAYNASGSYADTVLALSRAIRRGAVTGVAGTTGGSAARPGQPTSVPAPLPAPAPAPALVPSSTVPPALVPPSPVQPGTTAVTVTTGVPATTTVPEPTLTVSATVTESATVVVPPTTVAPAPTVAPTSTAAPTSTVVPPTTVVTETATVTVPPPTTPTTAPPATTEPPASTSATPPPTSATPASTSATPASTSATPAPTSATPPPTSATPPPTSATPTPTRATTPSPSVGSPSPAGSEPAP